MRDKIRLVSSAGTGYFYTTTKTNVLCRKNGNQNLIQNPSTRDFQRS